MMDKGGIGGRGRRDQPGATLVGALPMGYTDTTMCRRFRVDVDIITLVCNTLMKHCSECLF